MFWTQFQWGKVEGVGLWRHRHRWLSVRHHTLRARLFVGDGVIKRRKKENKREEK